MAAKSTNKKQIQVVLLASGNKKTWTVEVEPGARIIDLRRALGLNGGYNFTLEGHGFLADNADLYSLIVPGERERVFAAPTARLG